MLLVTGLSLLIGLSLLGWGAGGAALLERLTGLSLAGAMGIGEYGLLGLAVLAPIGFLLHVFIALDGTVGLAVVVIGLAVLVASRRRLLAALGFGLPRAVTAVLMLGMLAAFSGETLHQRMPFDSGLYHLQTILMTEDARVVLGAANIQDRFGDNSAWFVLCSLFALPGLPLGGAIVLNSVAGLFGLAGMAQRFGDALGRRGAAPSMVFAAGAIALIAVAKLLRNNIGAPSTDFPSALFTIYVFLLAVVVAETPSDERLDPLPRAALMIAFPLTALAVVCKLSQLPVGFALLLAGAAVKPWRMPTGRRIVVAGIAIDALIAVCRMVHGLALSGCALFPVWASCLATLPWTVPRPIADGYVAWITSFARIPDAQHGLVPDDWQWIGPWFASVRGERLVFCLEAVFALLPMLLALRLAARRRLRCLGETLDPDSRRLMFGLFAGATVGLCCWFLAAPAIRFGLGFLIAQPLILLSLAVPVETSLQRASWISQLLPPGLAMTGVFLAVGAAAQQTGASLLATRLPPIPVVELDARQTAGGYPYFMPRTGDSCWAARRFCTPQPSPGLEFGRFGLWQIATALP